MKRKRLLLLVPTIALSFGLFGCKNADTPGPDKPDPNPPIVEVTKVTKVILSIDDESGEGSLEKPLLSKDFLLNLEFNGLSVWFGTIFL